MRHLLVLALVACSAPKTDPTAGDAAIPVDDAAADATAGVCATRISYGDTWIHGAQHPAQDDVATGDITWDGTCIDDGASSYATLSNGWKPYFAGHGSCKLALDRTAACGAPSACTTHITYGLAWQHPQNHAAQFDDVTGRVFWDDACRGAGADSFANLSNGWSPHFTGASTCAITFRWDNCGGLYTNPVIPTGCADPGVVRAGNRYILSCTSGNAADAFPLYVSNDLVTWTRHGSILPAAAKPAWAQGDFWAPEIHPIGSRWVAYFSARNTDGRLSIGAASASDPLGPYSALSQPLVHDATMGLIDASEVTANGTPYLLWKEDGNAQNRPTPIHARALGPDGLSLIGAASMLITNDQSWEGNLVEGPFVVEHGGMFYLFYSGNAYYDARYAVGVARASSILGPYTKATAPIVVTGAAWVGPGHCSVVDGPGGDSYMVYHAWPAGHVNGPGDARFALVDQIVWRNGWPELPGAPSIASRPSP